MPHGLGADEFKSFHGFAENFLMVYVPGGTAKKLSGTFQVIPDASFRDPVHVGDLVYLHSQYLELFHFQATIFDLIPLRHTPPYLLKKFFNYCRTQLKFQEYLIV
jgi:hypothetical protein